MAQYFFGTGRLSSIPISNTGIATQFAALQSVSVDFSADLKELYGRNQFALDVARGKAKIQCKASSAIVDVNLYNNVFFGGTVSTGQQLISENEAWSIPTTPYQVTVSGAATFVQDLGVTFVSTGLPLTRVASGPATGQYSVSAVGVYTFAAADTTKAVLISYNYTATTGQQLGISNVLMGAVPSFQCVLEGSFKGKAVSLILYNCISTKFTLPLKMDDYTHNDFDFAAQDNGAGSIGVLSATNT